MTKFQRIKECLFGAGVIFFGVIMLAFFNDGYYVLMSLLALSMFIYGIRYIVFYITMARHMVGGISSLYRGIIATDLGVFTMSLSSIPKVYILLYFIALHGISGGVQLLRALEQRKQGAPGWRLKMLLSIGNLFIAIACIIFIRSEDIVVIIYAIGLFYSGAIRILNAVKKSDIIYIQ